MMSWYSDGEKPTNYNLSRGDLDDEIFDDYEEDDEYEIES